MAKLRGQDLTWNLINLLLVCTAMAAAATGGRGAVDVPSLVAFLLITVSTALIAWLALRRPRFYDRWRTPLLGAVRVARMSLHLVREQGAGP